MCNRGTIIAFSGALASGTGAVSRLVADRLGWRHVRFSDYIRRHAQHLGQDATDRGVLQRVGQQLVREQVSAFVTAVLELGSWQPGENLILDGLRHIEVQIELLLQLGNGADLHVVHIHLDEDARAARVTAVEGIDRKTFVEYDRHVTEAQIERVLPEYAELILEGSDPPETLVELVINRFGEPGRAPDDRGEAVSIMEPMLLPQASRHRAALSELAVQLVQESTQFSGDLSKSLRQPLADLVRSMNCYYSNLIEGHDTHPTDIERALRQDYSADPKKRDLQLEAKAHIAVQTWIDGGGLEKHDVTSEGALKEIHSRFCSALPASLLWVENPDTHERWRVVPGEYRTQHVRIGQHVPPSPGALSRFMQRFEGVYKQLGTLDLILAAAAAHHRLLWIHPFSDGNGRVARLMSHAMLARALNSHSIWSVARGLARSDADYKRHLAECDMQRRNDFDGRGNLSEEALAGFCRYFLERCLDQVAFMRRLMQLDGLKARMRLWVEEEVRLKRLPNSAARLLNALLLEGDLPLVEALEILGGGEPASGSALARLKKIGLLVPIDDERLQLAFPGSLGSQLFPGLFP